MIDNLIKQAQAEEFSVEVLAREEKSTEISILNGTVENISFSDITTYKIKAIYKGKTIIIETEEIIPETLIPLIKENIEMSDNQGVTPFAQNISFQNTIEPDEILNYENITTDLLNLETLKQNYPNLNTLTTLFRHTYEKIEIINHNTHMFDANSYNYYFANFSIQDQKELKACYLDQVSQKYDIKKWEKTLTEKIEETMEQLHSVSCKTQKYDILLENRCVYRILKTFSSMFFAETIRKKQSILTDKLQKQVFSKQLTIIEDPTNPTTIGKRIFDDEGVPTYYKEIIKEGKFITKLYNEQEALKENCKSTGNSFGVRNLYIKPGNKSYEELIQELQNGIIITNIEGLHAGINLLNGQISLQAEGWLVENSKKTKSLNMIILSTNILELFNSIKEIGNDLEFFWKDGGAPSLLIENITIAGKE